mmetsp:Transcript_129272/g.360016  ORF Transcript_129272/g.360016 Transcript_129272/m.360016 type:complete len:204 (-) Transcript_129272:1018-1629(-)
MLGNCTIAWSAEGGATLREALFAFWREGSGEGGDSEASPLLLCLAPRQRQMPRCGGFGFTGAPWARPASCRGTCRAQRGSCGQGSGRGGRHRPCGECRCCHACVASGNGSNASSAAAAAAAGQRAAPGGPARAGLWVGSTAWGGHALGGCPEGRSLGTTCRDVSTAGRAPRIAGSRARPRRVHWSRLPALDLTDAAGVSGRSF